MPISFDDIYKIIKKVPKGRVATYGQIAALAGYPRGAQMVGWALNQLHGKQLDDVPWQRIINAKGEISISRIDVSAKRQAELLQKEKVMVTYTPEGTAKIDLNKYGWLK